MKFQLSFLTLFLFFALGAQGQMKFNQHNPYVSNGDIFKLKKEGIDLSTRSYDDLVFQKNVQEFLALRKEYNQRKAGTVAITAGAGYMLLSGIGLILNERRNNPLDEAQSPIGAESALSGVFSTVVGVSLSVLTVRHFIKARKTKSLRNQKLKIVKKQYNSYN